MTDPQPQPEYIINEEMVQCIEAWTKRYPEVSKDIANVIRNRPHTLAAPASEPGLSKLCFGTITLACEECRACNEIETCTQKQKYLDYDKQQARKSEREQVLQSIHKKTFAMRHRASSEEVNNEAVILDYSAVYELLQSLRGGGAP